MTGNTAWQRVILLISLFIISTEKNELELFKLESSVDIVDCLILVPTLTEIEDNLHRHETYETCREAESRLQRV